MELSGRKRHCAWLRHRGLFMKRRPNACLSFVLKRVGLGTGDAGSTGERQSRVWAEAQRPPWCWELAQVCVW